MDISITRALSELKLLDKKIKDKTGQLLVATGYRGADKSVVDSFVKTETEKLQQVKDFIKRRDQIKSKVVESNAGTLVRVAGQDMFVASAIERKNSIQYEKDLLLKLRSQYYGVKSQVDNENDAVRNLADKQAESALGAETARAKGEEYKSIVEAYIAHNSVDMVSVDGLESLIEKMQDDIDEFESEVDFVLSESNTKTLISL